MARGRDCQPGAQLQTDPLPVLGQVGQVVQVPATGSHQGLLWREDRHLLCLAGLLHRMASARLCCRRGCLCVRTVDPGPELSGHRGVWNFRRKVKEHQSQATILQICCLASACVLSARNAPLGPFITSAPTPESPTCLTILALFSMQFSCLFGVLKIIKFFPLLILPSCHLPGVLEEEERQPGPPVGLHGLH